MAQIAITTTLDEDAAARLRERAQANGHTLEEEAQAIIRDAVGASQTEAAENEEDMATLFARRFDGLGFDGVLPPVPGFRRPHKPWRFDEDGQ